MTEASGRAESYASEFVVEAWVSCGDSWKAHRRRRLWREAQALPARIPPRARRDYDGIDMSSWWATLANSIVRPSRPGITLAASLRDGIAKTGSIDTS